MYIISWKEFEVLALELAKKIKESNNKYDSIVTVGRGGLLLGRMLSSVLGLPLGVVFAKTINNRYLISNEVSFLFEIKGNVLLVDDLMDDNANLILSKIKNNHKTIKNIDLASIFYKNKKGFVPHFYLNDIKNEMTLIFPYQERALKEKFKFILE